MGGNDHGFSDFPGATDNLVLNDRNLLERQFRAEVSSRDHNGIRRMDDFDDVLDGLFRFNLCNDFRVSFLLRNKRTNGFDIVAIPDEGQGDKINVPLHAECYVLPILIGDGWKIDIRSRKIDMTPGSTLPSCRARDNIAIGMNAHNIEHDLAVIQENPVRFAHIIAKSAVINGNRFLFADDDVSAEEK